MFGAYEAGVWSVLRGRVEFDLFAGASIGAITAWAAASDCPGDAWVDEWLNPQMASLLQWRFPRNPLNGCLDRSRFEGGVREVHARLTPVKPCAIAITDVLRRRAFSVETPGIGWRHLAASCALPALFPVYRIDGRLCMDGGLLGSVPLFAATERGAEVIFAVNLLPAGGPPWLQAARRALLSMAHRSEAPPASTRVVWIEPERMLGSARDSMYWTRENAARWIEQGRRDARRALETF